MAAIKKMYFWILSGIDYIQSLYISTRLGTEPCLIDRETSWHTSVTALKIKRTNSPQPLNLGPRQSIHWELSASALIQAKYLKYKAREKDLETGKLCLSETVAIFNIALINDTKDDLLTEELLNKPRISKPFY